MPDSAVSARRTVPGMKLTVEPITTVDRWEQIARDWDRLLRATPGYTGMQSFDFLSAWWRAFAAGRKLWILAFSDGGQLVGIAPFQIVERRILGRTYRVLQFLAMTEDILRPTVLFPAERREELLAALNRYLDENGRSFDLIELDEVASNDALIDGLRQLAEAGGYVFHRMPFHPCPFLDLSEWTLESFWQARSRKLRKNVRAGERKLAETGPIVLERYESPEDVHQGFDKFLSLARLSWKHAARVGLAADVRYEIFYAQLLERFAALHDARVLVLTAAGQPVAATFAVLFDGIYHSLQIVHDEAYADCSPGTLLESQELAVLLGDTAASRYEFMGGALSNKLRWTDQAVETVCLKVARPDWRLRAGELYEAAKPLGKRLLRYPRALAAAFEDGVWLVKDRLGTLLHPLPVLLDPAPRRAKPAAERWSLPVRAQSRSLLTFHGTAAVYQAVRSLNLAEGETVLIPSYNCGHELEPVLRAGASAGFYRVGPQLDVDLDDLAAQLDARTRAVLVTHYFGFPQRMQPIRSLCDAHGLVLIEDCAHALFSCDGPSPLGLAGDFAVYSLRKTLPLPYGGALVCHDARWPLPQPLPPPPRLSTVSKWLDRYRKVLLSPQPVALRPLSVAAFLSARLAADLTRGLGRGLGVLQWDPDDESFGFPDDVLEWGVAPSVERALERVRPELIVAARRRNFERLLSAAERFTDCTTLLAQLPPGVCPLYFPVMADNPSALLQRLRASTVSATRWWDQFHPAVPWQRFPEARRLKKHVVGLPIHQDLTDSHMDRIVEVLERS